MRFFDKKDVYVDPEGRKLRLFRPSKPLIYSVAIGAVALTY